MGTRRDVARVMRMTVIVRMVVIMGMGTTRMFAFVVGMTMRVISVDSGEIVVAFPTPRWTWVAASCITI